MDHTAFVSKQHHILRYVSLLAPNYVQVEYIIFVNYDKPPRNSEKVSTFHNDCDGIIVYDRGDNYIQC